MKKYDIGLVVVTGYNYGNNLTNYGLYNYLKNLGYSVLIIDIPWKKNPFLPYFCRKRTELFLESPYEDDEFAESFETRWDVIKLNEYCRMFVLGSDQLWNYNYFLNNSNYFTCLDWVLSDKYKVTYATSIGSGNEGWDPEKMQYLLQRFQKISLREIQSVEWLNSEFDMNAVHVMDSIFLGERKSYNEMVQKGMHRLPENSYVGAYLLDPDDWKYTMVSYISDAKSLGEKVVISGPELMNSNKEYADISRDFKEEEWLALIGNSTFFVTDSFHGLCMALIFHKEFLVVFDKESSRGLNRMVSLLGMLGLERRLIIETLSEAELCNIINEKIDYQVVDEILTRSIKNSTEWFERALQEGMSYCGEKKEYDNFIVEYYKLKKELDTTELECRQLRNQVWLEFLKRKGVDKVVAWGAGWCFSTNISMIKEIYDLDIVCDRDAQKWKADYYPGVSCVSPEELWKMKKTAVIIMIKDEIIVAEIAKELEEHGIEEHISFNQWNEMILGDRQGRKSV